MQTDHEFETMAEVYSILRQAARRAAAAGKYQATLSEPPPGLGLRVVLPLKVEVATNGGLVTVWCAQFDQIGYGPTKAAAMQDFWETLAEFYRTLQASQKQLGPDLRRKWRVLRTYVVLT